MEMPGNMEAYGVLVAPIGDVWRARILTFPCSIWTIPGGGTALKFIAKTPQAAESEAIRFVERHCAQRGYTPRNGLELAAPGAPRPALQPGRAPIVVEPRWPIVLPVRYERIGSNEGQLSISAVTRNVSERGVFVQTPAPVEEGRDILLGIRLPADRYPLEGRVVWSRTDGDGGRPPGMGIRLVMAPPAYLEYIRSLPPPTPTES